MTQRKAPGAASTTPRAVDQKLWEKFKGRVSYITQRSQTRPITRLILGLRGYVYRQFNRRGDRVSG